ncbi:MAG: hypothetical protein ACLP7A_07985 [Desulfobaccales bacterium]
MDGPRENSFPNRAERLFVQEGRTLEEISSRLKVDLTTLLGWQKKGEWDRKRSALLANPENLAERLRLALGKMLDALENGEELDPKAFNSIARAATAVKNLDRGDYDLKAAGLKVMEDFTRFLKEHLGDPEELQLIGARIRAWFRSLE